MLVMAVVFKCYPYFFLEYFKTFRFCFKAFDPFGVDSCIGRETGTEFHSSAHGDSLSSASFMEEAVTAIKTQAAVTV